MPIEGVVFGVWAGEVVDFLRKITHCALTAGMGTSAVGERLCEHEIAAEGLVIDAFGMIFRRWNGADVGQRLDGLLQTTEKRGSFGIL